MTREEAVKILKSTLAYDSDFAEAKQMAIEALEREPCDKRTEERTETHACDCISRKDAIDGLEYEAEMLKRVLDNMDVVGQEREKFAWGLGLIQCFIEDIKELPSKEIINMKSVFNLSEDAERGEEK